MLDPSSPDVIDVIEDFINLIKDTITEILDVFRHATRQTQLWFGVASLLFCVGSWAHEYMKPNTYYIEGLITVTVVFGLLNVIIGINANKNSQWKKYPKHPPNKYVNPEIYYEYYGGLKTDMYPNIVFIGKLSKRLDRISYRETMLNKFNKACTQILLDIHTDIKSDRWLPAIDRLLQEPEYAQTFAYIHNITENPQFVKLINNPDKHTPDELYDALRKHLGILDEIHTVLTIVINDNVNRMEQVQIDDMIRMGSTTFDKLEPVEEFDDLYDDPKNEWLVDMINDYRKK